MTLPCPRAGKWIRGCRFEACYDWHPGNSGHITGDTNYTVAIIRAAKVHVYVRHVCVTCGKTIERPAATSEGGKDDTD